MPANGRKDLIADLVKLKYDLAVDLYRQRAIALAAEAATRKGNYWEYAAYKVFGTDMMAHLALWLDPTWQFKRNWKSKDASVVYLARVIPANRTRTRCTVWSGKITGLRYWRSWTDSSDPVWTGSRYTQGPWKSGIPIISNTSNQYGLQYPIYGFVSDTTWKSRNPGRRIPKSDRDKRKENLESQGELEIWNPTFEPTRFSANFGSPVYIYAPFGTTNCANISKGGNKSTIGFSGASASIAPTAVEEILLAERAYALAQMRKYAAGMLADCLVTRRRFNIGYQIGEFKDLPQTLRGTLAVFRDIEHLIGWKELKLALTSPTWWSSRNYAKILPFLEKLGIANRPDKMLSSAYLTFKFGYQSMYQALTQFLDAPEKVAKDVNILIDRNGGFQTFRRKKDIPTEEWAAVPSINLPIPYPLNADPSRPYKVVTKREAKLRCVVNNGVCLPRMIEPKLRKQMFYEKMGWPPRPSDLWNLIPWTWLLEWFLSANDYLKLLEEIHLDRSLINWGLLTYESKLEAKASVGSMTDTSSSITIRPSPNVLEVTHLTYVHEAVFKADYQIRKDIGSLANATTITGKNLRPDQYSILSALISQFT